jgi:uncharacterized protein YceK
MTSTRGPVLLALATLLVSGCGTIANLQTGKPDLYGGVQHDVQLLETPRPPPQGIGIRNLGALVLFVDLPLSVVGDTLSIPLANYEWHRGEGQADAVGGGGGARRPRPPSTPTAALDDACR